MINEKKIFEKLQKNRDKGLVIVVSAPSGSGKTTLCRLLVENVKKAVFSVSLTSRAPRPGETDGIDYSFVAEEEFLKKAEGGELFEWARVHDHFYGTSREFVEQSLLSGIHVILDIDVQGGIQVKEKYPEAVLIFVLPPSMEELKKRLDNRNQDSPEEIEKRMRNAKEEMLSALDYDYLVENRELDKAIEEMQCIVAAEKCRLR